MRAHDTSQLSPTLRFPDAPTPEKMKRFPLFCLLLLAALPGWAQQHYSEIDFPELRNFQVPEAQRAELPNGITVFLIEDRSLPLVNLSARIGVGSVHEPSSKTGLASITGSVMRTGGTTNIPGDLLNERLEAIGAVIETSIGQTSGSAFMSSLTEYVDEVLPLYVDVLMNPAFPEDKIELAKTQQRSGIARRNDNPQNIAFREFNKLLYGADSPYASQVEYATLDAIERNDLVAFHRQYIVPNNVILGVWGDFDADAMLAKLREAFSVWPKDPQFAQPVMPPVDTASDYGVYYAEKNDATQTTLLLGHPGEVRLDHPDYAALTMMNQVLSGFSGRLFQNVRDEQGLAYAVFGGYSANYDRPGQFYTGIMTKSGTTVEAANALLAEIESIRSAPPTDEEIAEAKDSYLNSFVFNFDTRSEVVGRMMTYAYYDYPTDFLEQQKARFEAVTAADVQRAAQQYIHPEDLKILAVGQQADFDQPLSTLGDVTTLDISIPTGEEEDVPEADDASLAQGRALLTEAMDALGGAEAFRSLTTLEMDATRTVTTPDNVETSTNSTLLYAFPDRFRLTLESPMGELVVLKRGDELVMQTPQGTLPAPPPVRSQILEGLWQGLPYLFHHADRVTPQYLGQEVVDGTNTEVVLITAPAGSPFRLYLDAATKQPVQLVSSMMNPQTGARVQSTEAFTDFRSVGNVMLPFQRTTTAEGAPASTTVFTRIEANQPLDESLFE